MLQYIILILVLLFMIITVYIKTKYGFWVDQPVFHVYDLRYMIFPPGIINNELPEHNKYTNFKDVETIVFPELSKIRLDKFIQFINQHYLRQKGNDFSPAIDNVVPYFRGCNDKSFISFYNEKCILMDLKKGTTVDDTKIIGVMTSRPIHISINNGDKDANFYAYYVDYLCVDKLYRKKGIAPQIIQTHHYNQSHINKNICVSLFKREDELTGIVPLCVYSTYGFAIDKWDKPPDLDGSFSILEINAQNIHVLFDFIKLNTNLFDIVINTDIGNIIELLKTNNIFIYVILVNQQVLTAYFFRKTCVFINDKEVLSCFASINNSKDNHIFVHGFKIIFWQLANKYSFGLSAIENISHNNLIIDNLLIKNTPFITSPTAYFFYNFAHYTIHPNKVLIIN